MIELTKNQNEVLARLRRDNKPFIAEITELHWKRGEEYYVDARVDARGIRRAFKLGNKEALNAKRAEESATKK